MEDVVDDILDPDNPHTAGLYSAEDVERAIHLASGCAESTPDMREEICGWISEVTHASSIEPMLYEENFTLGELKDLVGAVLKDERVFGDKLAHDPFFTSKEVDVFHSYMDRMEDVFDNIQDTCDTDACFRDMDPLHRHQIELLLSVPIARSFRRRARRRRRKRKVGRRREKAARSRGKERDAKKDEKRAKKDLKKAKRNPFAFRRRRRARKDLKDARRRRRRARGKAESRERKAGRSQQKLDLSKQKRDIKKGKKPPLPARTRIRTPAGIPRYVHVSLQRAPKEECVESDAYDLEEYERDVDAPLLYEALLQTAVEYPYDDEVAYYIQSYAIGSTAEEDAAWCERAANYMILGNAVYRARMYARLLAPGGRAKILKKVKSGKYAQKEEWEKLEDIKAVAEMLSRRSFLKKRKRQWAAVVKAAEDQLARNN